MGRIQSILTDIAGRLQAIWEGQNRQTRILAVTGITAIVAALAALSWLYFGRQPSYETLFSNLSSEDAASVTQRLKDDKIPYRLQRRREDGLRSARKTSATNASQSPARA